MSEGQVSEPEVSAPEVPARAAEPKEPQEEDEEEGESAPRWGLAAGLCAVTFASMLYAGAGMHAIEVVSLSTLLSGWDFAVPLITILLFHEFGHYIVGRVRGVDISPPYFIPMPIGMLGTMGAVIRMRGRIKTRDALFDVGAAGPYAGLLIALPVLIYGIVTSPVTPMPEDAGSYIIEGRSLLYAGLLYALKGPMPEGHDIFLSPAAFAGWAGLMVTMMNLLPVGQLDGGHVAYALLGERHHRLARAVLYALPLVAVMTGLYYGGTAYLEGYPRDAVLGELSAGLHWLVWFGMLQLIARYSGGQKHPPTDDDTLSKGRRIAAWGTLLLFVLLFMPFWIRTPPSHTPADAPTTETVTPG